jgi:hypothetical protein
MLAKRIHDYKRKEKARHPKTWLKITTGEERVFGRWLRRIEAKYA